MDIAIIGTGISGLAAAWRLRGAHRLTLIEAGEHVGGHTHTHDVEVDGVPLAVDTGFIVYNEHTYPEFCRMLGELGVASRPTSMSFGAHDPATGFCYGTAGLGWLARRRNLVDPRLWRLLTDILRFFRHANAALDERGLPLDDLSLRDFVARCGLSDTFVRYYIVPMTAAVWSAPPDTALEYPARSLLRFLRNHGLLSATGAPVWHTIDGGSRSYVRALLPRLDARVLTREPVASVRRTDDHVQVQLRSGHTLRFDRAILACHSDQALAMLADATPAEREVLGAIPYQRNEAVLHTDAAMLPPRRGAWASWNYRLDPDPSRPATVTYWMNRLQHLPLRTPVCVTLNDTASIRPERILRRVVYEHPVYTHATIAAQQRYDEICPPGSPVALAGAYWFNGFHEDGMRSGLRAAERVTQ